MFVYHTALIRKAIDYAEAGYLVCLDRWWPSEQIYAPIFRDSLQFDLEHRFMDRVGQAYGVVYVYCKSDLKPLQQRFYQRALAGGEDYHHIETVWERYEDLYYSQVHREDVLEVALDPQMPQTQDLWLLGLANIATSRWHKAQWQRQFRDDAIITGNVFGAKYVFIADELNPNKSHHNLWPFHDYADSSLFLARACDNINLDESKVLWTNAYIDGKIHDLLHPEVFEGLRVITMGGRALRAAAIRGIDVDFKMYHPQYYRRFHANDGRLEEDLLGALYE